MRKINKSPEGHTGQFESAPGTKNKMQTMNRSIMIQKLLRRFGENGIAHSVWMHTQRTFSLEECTDAEICEIFSLFFPTEMRDPLEVLQKEQRLKHLRSIVLKDAQYLGLYDPQDWSRFNSFMKNHSPLKKQLNKYTEDEFEPLIKQFKSMKTKYDKEAKITGSSAWYHKNRFPKPSKN